MTHRSRLRGGGHGVLRTGDVDVGQRLSLLLHGIFSVVILERERGGHGADSFVYPASEPIKHELFTLNRLERRGCLCHEVGGCQETSGAWRRGNAIQVCQDSRESSGKCNTGWEMVSTMLAMPPAKLERPHTTHGHSSKDRTRQGKKEGRLQQHTKATIKSRRYCCWNKNIRPPVRDGRPQGNIPFT